jgi:2-iminoacetate synthase
MSFYEEYQKYKALDFNPVINRVMDDDIARALGKDRIDTRDFMALLSPRAEMHLEAMARKAHELSLRHFGKSILLYTPLYISNYCVNRCLYCGFNAENKIKRKKLSLEEIEKEAEAISATGLRHILILTGEAKKHTPVSYISDAARILRKYFDSISIEIFPLTEGEYSEVISAGVDGLTIYQEVYDEDIYERVHLSGPKRDYRFRLEAPERACRAGIRSINIGALLGLGEWRREVFIAGLHAQYLQKKHADVETSLSLPRIRPHAGSSSDIYPVEDSNLVQALLALRIFLPFA